MITLAIVHQQVCSYTISGNHGQIPTPTSLASTLPPALTVRAEDESP